MKNFISNNILYIIGAVVGAVGGFLYWNFIGCNSGSCAITSSPVNSSLYGALMGSVFFTIFKKENKTTHEIR